MTAQIEWIEKPWIMAVDYSGAVTVDDVRQTVINCVAQLQDHPTHFLIDMTETVSVDPSTLELSSLSEWIYHPNGRWFVYIRPTGAFKALINLRHRNPIKQFDDRKAALEFLQKAVQIGIKP